MKIKRFVAETMREALEQVRSELGEDAIILSNKRIDGGIELITAVDYDETLIDEAMKRVRPPVAPAPVEPAEAAITARAVPAAAPAVRSVAPRPVAAKPVSKPAVTGPGAKGPSAPAMDTRASQPAPAAAAAAGAERPRVVWSQDDGLLGMRREVESLRSLLQEQLSSLTWSDRLRREPLRALVLRDLSLLGIAPDIARKLAERVPAGGSSTVAKRIAPAVVLRHLPTVDFGTLEQGGVLAIVGPTGVGKTTTIAKLAARWAMRYGAANLALVSLDHYRIGARDQLLNFARILGVPMHVAGSVRELGGVLQGLSGRRLVLIDTAGMSPRDPRLAEQFATLAVPGRRIRTVLALAANAEHLALEDAVRSYARVQPEALILTKLDEAASLGSALSVSIRHALPLSWLADGQRVPDDLHGAAQKRVWLVKQAIKLAERSRLLAGIDENYLATHFGKVATHG